MLFNSIQYAVFLPLVFILYWFVFNKNVKQQNVLLLVVSYIFYGWWDWRFCGLIFISTVTDFIIGQKIFNSSSKIIKKRWLLGSLFVNLSLLGVFKYFNFFTESFVDTLGLLGVQADYVTINVILPVGISFYTFQTLSYTLDVYNDKLKPTTSFIDFATFVAFFPQLVAGPIERASRLLPQISNKRSFEYNSATQGLYLIFWGLFKKIMVADNCAPLVDYIFGNTNLPASVLVMGVVLFTFQIYGDFSGYSDIAIGTAKLFGVDLMINFKYPNFARNVGEYWKRWHVSLSQWFRDYLYIPLGGSRMGKVVNARNVIIVFMVSALWHGANWTFIMWGAMHVLFFLPSFFIGSNRKWKNKPLLVGSFVSRLREAVAILITFILVTSTRVFFRAESLEHAIRYFKGMWDKSIFTIPLLRELQNTELILVFVFITIMTGVEYMYRNKEFVFEDVLEVRLRYRIAGVFTLILAIFFLGGSAENFIYFQF